MPNSKKKNELLRAEVEEIENAFHELRERVRVLYEVNEQCLPAKIYEDSIGVRYLDLINLAHKNNILPEDLFLLINNDEKHFCMIKKSSDIKRRRLKH